jgi:G3E family GTPase
MSDPRKPVSVLTGFLGAGKTTILSHLLGLPDLQGAAVLINELGEVALDHHLIREVRGDVAVLGSGCVCCTVRGDLVRALGELADSGATFDRVLLETTGMADPTGVLATLCTHPGVARDYRPAAVVTAVDGVLGSATLDRHPEAVKQAALADHLILTKADVATDLDALEARLRGINPGATITRAVNGDVAPELLLSTGDRDVTRWLAHDHHDHHHHDGVSTMTVSFSEPVRLGALGLWLSLMTQMHGESILRIKGIVNVEDDPEPMVLHCVQHLVYPPRALSAWPSSDHRTHLVFITRGLAPHTLNSLKQSLAETLGQPAV